MKCTSSKWPRIPLERTKMGTCAPTIQLNHLDHTKATSFLSEKECIAPN